VSYRKLPVNDAVDTKVRNCLSCLNPFSSAWAGERICPRCKNTTSWRSGAARSRIIRP
jgi:predicted RNA-binding Zn-ribbon protein involved in translation (DUF1610 family)